MNIDAKLTIAEYYDRHQTDGAAYLYGPDENGAYLIIAAGGLVSDQGEGSGYVPTKDPDGLASKKLAEWASLMDGITTDDN